MHFPELCALYPTQLICFCLYTSRNNELKVTFKINLEYLNAFEPLTVPTMVTCCLVLTVVVGV